MRRALPPRRIDPIGRPRLRRGPRRPGALKVDGSFVYTPAADAGGSAVVEAGIPMGVGAMPEQAPEALKRLFPEW